MVKELWLEFGFIQKEQNNWHEMLWYNEGRWQEFPYWVRHLLKNIFRKDTYHLLRWGNLKIEI